MFRSLIVLIALGMACACGGATQSPELASSSSNPAYALHYSSQINELVVRIEAQREVAAGSLKKMEKFAVEVGPSDPELVADLYLAADKEGRSEAFAQRQTDSKVIQSFFVNEEPALSQRIAASTQYAAKQNGCDVNLLDASQRGLQRGLQEQLKQRRRQVSGAQVRVLQSKETLGKQAASLLPDQIDEISLTSYIVYVGLESDELVLAQRAQSISSIRGTLEDHRDEVAAAPEPDAAELERVDAALVELTNQENRAQLALQDVEARRTQLRQDYEQTLEGLVESARNQPAQTK